MSSSNDNIPTITSNTNSVPPEFQGLKYQLTSHANTGLIWIIIIAVVAILFFVLKRLFK